MIRAYKYRIYPTAEQKAYLAKAFGCCRYAYNYCVREHERLWEEEQKTATDIDLMRQLGVHKNDLPWLNEVDSSILQYAAKRVVVGWDRFFDHTNIHPPHERKKGVRQYQSFTTSGNGLQISFKRNFVRLPKIGFIRAKIHRRFDGEIKCATIKQNAAGHYHVSLFVEVGDCLPPMKPFDTDNALGIDLGVRHFATLSTGEHIDMPDVSRSVYRRAFLQRRLKQQKEGSKGYKKTQQQIASLSEHISNVRLDFHHKTAARLCTQYSAICMETLNVNGMKQAVGKDKDIKNNGFNRKLQHVGLGQFSELLEDKARRTGTHFVRIDRWEPSTKRCHVCGYVLPDIALSVEEWTCPECGTLHDRDHNAAINIRRKGIEQLEIIPKNKSNEILPLAEREEKPAKVPVPPALRTGKATDTKADRRPSSQIDDGTARPRLAYPLAHYVMRSKISHESAQLLRKIRLKEKSLFGMKEFMEEVGSIVKLRYICKEIGFAKAQTQHLFCCMNDKRFTLLVQICHEILPNMIDNQIDRLNKLEKAAFEKQEQIRRREEERMQRRLLDTDGSDYVYEKTMMYYVSLTAVAELSGVTASTVTVWAKTNAYTDPKPCQVCIMQSVVDAYLQVAKKLRQLKMKVNTNDEMKEYVAQARKLVQLNKVCESQGISVSTFRGLRVLIGTDLFSEIQEFISGTLPEMIEKRCDEIKQSLRKVKNV